MKNRNGNGKLSSDQVMATLNAHKKIDLTHYWHILWQRKWILFTACIAMTSVSIVYAWLKIRPIYEVTASVYIQNSQMTRSVQAVTPGLVSNPDRRRLANRIMSIEYLTELSKRLNLAQDKMMISNAKSFQASAPWLSDEDAMSRAVVRYLREKLNLTINATSDQFQLSVRDESPHQAYNIVKSMTEIFVDQSINTDLKGIRDVKEFSDEQLAIYENKVAESEQKLRELQIRLTSSKAKNAGSSSDNITRLQELKSATQIAITHRQKRLNELENSLANRPLTNYWNENAELIQQKIRLDEKLIDFSHQLNDIGWQSSYDIKFNNDINNLRQEIHNKLKILVVDRFPEFNAEESAKTIEYQLVYFDLYYLRQRSQVIETTLNNFFRQIRTEPTTTIELEKLEEELKQNRKIYQVFLEQSRGSQIQEAFQNSDAEYKYQIIEPAQMPIYAVGGSKRNFVLMALLVGLILGVAVIVTLEFFDQTVRSAEDVEASVGIPVWGAIPKMTMPEANIESHLLERLKIKMNLSEN